MREHRVIIAGSRSFDDYNLLCQKMDAITASWAEGTAEVVSGMARGADTLGEQWAATHGIPVTQFPAQWDKYGRSAGYKRNDQMRDYATHLVAFHQADSRGTAHMIRSARTAGLGVRVVKC